MKNKFLEIILNEMWSIFNSRTIDGKIPWINGCNGSIPIIDNNGSISPKRYNMRYRELGSIFLISTVFDFIFSVPHYFTPDDSGKCDGFIFNGKQEIPVECVMAYNHGEPIGNIDEKHRFIANSLLKKFQYGGSFEMGKKYLEGKILIVDISLNTKISEYDPGKILNIISAMNPGFAPAEIYFLCLNKEINEYNLLYNITRVQTKLGIMSTYEVLLDLGNKTWKVGVAC